MEVDKAIYFITGNSKKLEELNQILGSQFPVKSISIDLPELQGEPEEISKEKCKLAIAKMTLPNPVLVEDTCLCYNALKGLPGPYMFVSNHITFEVFRFVNVEATGLNNLLAAYTDKSAYALCTFSLIWSKNEEPITFVGRCDGKIVPARGPNNFGWDPIFQPDGFDQTFAEMEKDVKNKISHRSKALEKLRTYLEKNTDKLKK